MCGFCSSDLWNLCSFSIEEQFLCEAQGCSEDFVPQSEVFYISIDSSYWAFGRRKEVM
jgi:hypothetical protein